MVTNEPRPSEPARNREARSGELDGTTTRRVAPDAAELASLRSWIVRHLNHRVEDEAGQMFLIAVTEAVTNAIEAHRRLGSEASVEVTIDVPGGVVHVDDEGGGLEDRLANNRAMPQPSALRGRGLLIIRAICPEARFDDRGSGLRVVLPFPG